MSNAKTLNEVVAAIRRVVAYDWEDEKADFEQHAGEESHIFRDLMAIREWLDGFPHGDELAEQPYRLRAFRERQGTLWHEVEPDRFRIALDDESHETTIARHWRWPTPGWSLDALRAECGPLTEVTEVAGT